MRNYPFRGSVPYARNQWYIAGWSAEIGASALSRVILNQEIVLFRDESGSVVAVSGLCPHRWAPLAGGVISGSTIECPYHGAKFDRNGQCVHLPFQSHVPNALRLRAYSIVEQGGLVWIWPGDADQIDLALLPQTNALGLGVDSWRLDTSPHLLVKARAQILLENLFDQSHVGIAHCRTLGSRAPTTALAKPSEIVDQPGYLSIRHDGTPCATDAAIRALFPDIGEHMIIRQRSELFGVSLINGVGSQTFATDAAGGGARLVGCMNFVHGVTPATETTTHYFAGMTRDFALDNAELSAALTERNERVIAEDVAMLEAIEPHLDAYADSAAEINFPADAAAMRVRRRMERLIAATSANRQGEPEVQSRVAIYSE
jgi:vanillate O-demethylase monooxygenase subunit